MSDKELLKLAAKAAGKYAPKKDCPNGWEGIRPETWGCFTMGGEGITPDYQWNPLTDDGDAIRLAASLNLCVCFTLGESNPPCGTAMVGYSPWDNKVPIATERYSDPYEKLAATRRAIVRAAAEIGKAMP